MNKEPGLQRFLDVLSGELTGKPPQEDFCRICGKLVDMKNFRAEIDRREYTISGTCQSCQDSVKVYCEVHIRRIQ